MSVRKDCKYKGCPYADHRCEHEWVFDVMHQRVRYHMLVNSFAFMHGATLPVKSKQEAEKRWHPLFLAEIYAGRDPRHEIAPPPVTTVAAFISDYTKRYCEAEQLNMSTEQYRLARICERFGELEISSLEPPGPIEDFKADLMEEGLTNATVNRYLARLRHMTNWAFGRGLMRRLPFYHKLTNPAGVKLLKGENQRTRRLQDCEEQRLLEAADGLWPKRLVDSEHTGRVMRARIEVALDFGLRRGEMLKVKNRDIDWHAKPDPILTISWGNAKSRKSRKIALVSPRVVAWLQSRRLVGGADGHPYGDGTGALVEGFRSAWEGVLALAGITISNQDIDGDLHWHDLRHECGSRCAERGVDIKKVQELFGHANITTTQRYFNTSVNAVGSAQRAAFGWAESA